jgi:hypothetical protein
MNMNKSIKNLTQLAAAGALAILAQNAQSSVLYNNTSGNQSENFNYTGQAGNEVVLAGTASQDLVTGLTFQYDLTGTGTASADVVLNLWENNGPLVSGYPSPHTLLYSTTPFALTSFTSGAQLSYGPSDFGGTGVVVPKDFTWTVSFTGLTAGESAGLGLYSPPTVGANFGDAWYNSGSSWALDVATAGNPPLEFGAKIVGTAVPDSSCLPISALAVLAGFAWMKRSLRSA